MQNLMQITVFVAIKHLKIFYVGCFLNTCYEDKEKKHVNMK